MIKTPCRQHWYTVNQSWVLITYWYNPAEVGALVTEPPLKLAIHGEFCSSACPEKHRKYADGNCIAGFDTMIHQLGQD